MTLDTQAKNINIRLLGELTNLNTTDNLITINKFPLAETYYIHFNHNDKYFSFPISWYRTEICSNDGEIVVDMPDKKDKEMFRLIASQ